MWRAAASSSKRTRWTCGTWTFSGPIWMWVGPTCQKFNSQLGQRDRDRQRDRTAVAARNAHRLKRQRRYFHRLAVDLHFQEMVLLRPGAYIGALHLALHVASMQL